MALESGAFPISVMIANVNSSKTTYSQYNGITLILSGSLIF